MIENSDVVDGSLNLFRYKFSFLFPKLFLKLYTINDGTVFRSPVVSAVVALVPAFVAFVAEVFRLELLAAVQDIFDGFFCYRIAVSNAIGFAVRIAFDKEDVASEVDFVKVKVFV